MQKLIDNIKQTVQTTAALPFSVYSSMKEQNIFNVPVIKPLLIFVLSGVKKLGANAEIACPAGSFVFLSNSPRIDMRNIPKGAEYFALLIEFEYHDFDHLAPATPKTEKYFQGEITEILKHTLTQFVEWASVAPPELWPLRRQEFIQVLRLSGFTQVNSIMEPPTLSHKLHAIFSQNIMHELDAQTLSSMLAMSEATLRRKLSLEGSSLQAIKDSARLSYGLQLIQTSHEPIGLIAEQCGYRSPSRFTDKFKQLFGLTPSELRKTRLSE